MTFDSFENDRDVKTPSPNDSASEFRQSSVPTSFGKIDDDEDDFYSVNRIEELARQEASRRLLSLDALRGLNMLFIVGLATLIVNVCDLWPDAAVARRVAAQMEHVEWNGIRHHDSIFPLFLFLAGVAFPFSLAKQRANGRSTRQICLKVAWRGLALVLLGLIYTNKINFNFSEWRYPGVLQHIGIAWALAAFIFLATNRIVQIAICVVILVGYWLTLALVPAPDVNPPEAFTSTAYMERASNLLTPDRSESIQFNLSPEGCVAGYVDRTCVPGKLYKKTRDPEGLLSTIPAIVTALLGMMFGAALKVGDDKTSKFEKAGILIVGGLGLTTLGLLWHLVFPMNKNLWNSSFVCFVGGYSALALGVFYLIIDVWNKRAWAFVFVVVGMNSITIYMVKRIVDFSNARDFFFGDAVSRLPEKYQMIGTSCAGLIVAWAFLFWLYKRRVFLKV